ncbi:MAG: hypothetical protein IJ763_07995 [Lachnospiraceae bacterium]|nr:hypothetical protein [Lachnospiraceae bacterium]
MPNINRIRVNNVKYNFGSQAYDDFTMRMYGKNTIYDLANGGGKSVLMLLLLQNMLPNSTLDEKQPIEKLFRSGNGNTVIHSLVEWKLDEPYDEEGYRYMTTGFCARKAKDSESEENASKDVCSIEYFNYIIFYREYNKNDIINLPLVKNGERISYSGLKNYLKELGSNDMSLKVVVFDRKGEYQRFISGYGIHESQWEIIRGINKTEGHVRTFFENNYKTTRKVVEDLLIEEIIEKAFMVKTNRDDSQNESMAKLLMDIKGELTTLAKKKKDISNYDYQIELIEVLSDKVASFMNLYEEQDNLSKTLADIYVTGEQYAKDNEEHMRVLEEERDRKYEQKHKQRERIECLKVSRDKRRLDELKIEAQDIGKKIDAVKKKTSATEHDYNLKRSINDYILYLDDKKKYDECDSFIKLLKAGTAYDDEQIFTYVYNIKLLIDKKLEEIKEKKSELNKDIATAKLDREYHEKLITEARLNLAVAEASRKKADEDIVTLSERLSAVRMSMNNLSFVGNDEQIKNCEEEMAAVKSKLDLLKKTSVEAKEKLNDEQGRLLKLENEKEETDKIIASIRENEQEIKEAIEKLENIKSVYAADDEGKLFDVISDRISSCILELADIKNNIKKCEKRKNELKDKRLISPSKSVKKLMEYIETRHGISAMFGMDYLSALDSNTQEEILDINPLLPYGVVLKEFDVIKDDPNIHNIDTDDETVYVYDMSELSKKAVYIGEGAVAVHADKDFFLNDDTADRLIRKEDEKEKELRLSLEVKEKILGAYREDREFVIKITESDMLEAKVRLENTVSRADELQKQISECEKLIKSYRLNIENAEKEITEKQGYYEELTSDINKLYTANEISKIIDAQEKNKEKAVFDESRLGEEINALVSEKSSEKVDVALLETKLNSYEKQEQELLDEWEDNYKDYYNIDREYEILPNDYEELKTLFMTAHTSFDDDKKAVEDKKLLMETLKTSMQRSLNIIADRDIDIKDIERIAEEEDLYTIEEDVINTYKDSIEELKLQTRNYEQELITKNSEIDRLNGSIDYAIENIRAAFGEFVEEESSLSEITATLADGEKVLVRLDNEAKEADKELKRYTKEQGYMLEIYKDVKRIITTNDIDTKNAVLITSDKEGLREIFEDALIKYDKNNKSLDRAKNELLRFKGNTAAALDKLNMYEMAGTIRDDVNIPSSYPLARELNENLKSIIDFIRLEKDRVEKSLSDMENIKANFEEQCLQRCLDVRTELDKLPKLSRIVSEGETIQVVDLSIPYVKEEFLRQKMSDYIEKVVEEADSYDNDSARMKYIRSSLTLKKLFGVIVTDMNAIKLILYKRERIKEQSRYLKYEEAVGSTGQSQGIYIQFLVAIINYIAGMYQMQSDAVHTKTIFIDNPFGAAKDVYIWEPIFELLKANKVQLIVPARGVTPAITGRFDVNYILGQQMSDKTQLTVVTDYVSKVEQEEVEYRDLEYEQVSFDFI